MSLDIGPSRYLDNGFPKPGVLTIDTCKDICTVLNSLQSRLDTDLPSAVTVSLVGSAAYEYYLTTKAATLSTPTDIRVHNERVWRPRSKDAKPVDFDILLTDNWRAASECRTAVELAADWVVNTFQPTACTIEPRQVGIACDFSNGPQTAAPVVIDNPDGFVCRATLPNGRHLDIMAAVPWTDMTEYQSYMPIPEARCNVGAYNGWSPDGPPIPAHRPSVLRFHTRHAVKDGRSLVSIKQQPALSTMPFVSFATPLVKTILWGLRWSGQLNYKFVNLFMAQPFPLDKLNYLADKYGVNYCHPAATDRNSTYLLGSQLLNQSAQEQIVWAELVARPRDYLAANEQVWLDPTSHRLCSDGTGDLTQRILNCRWPADHLTKALPLNSQLPSTVDFMLGWRHDGAGALEVVVNKK